MGLPHAIDDVKSRVGNSLLYIMGILLDGGLGVIEWD